MTRPLRLTHVVFDLNGGGMESLVAAMAVRFAGGPVTMSAITLSGREGRVGRRIRPLLDRYIVARHVPGLSMILPLGLARDIRATRPDVVHLHSGAWYKGALAARLAGVPRVVYTEHGREHDDPALLRWLDRRAARRTDAVVAVSGRLRDYLVRAVGVEPRRLLTIGNGVDTGCFAPGPAPASQRAALGIPPDALVVGSIGRIEPVKAYGRLIDAVARVPQASRQPVHLVIYGEGTDRPAVEAAVARLGLRARVHLPGWTDDPASAYRMFDVFALTSVSEGASVSLMEALASGVCPVVMDVGANAEIVGPDLRGQVVPAADVEGFARVLADTFREPDRRSAIGAAGRRRAVAAYSLEAMIAAYERVYRADAGPEAGA